MNKKQISLLLSNAVLAAFAQDRPNILVLSIEDTSWYEFACYGNKCVQTPNLDKLASDGIMFKYAYSNGPQSSPARSGIITGAYASTYAMEQHRSGPATPPNIFYPQLLRDAGYYCTNNAKTDYNTTTNNKICWDECSNKASYNSANRPADKPFFSIYNAGMTHMGRVRSYHLDGRRDFTKDGINVNNAPLPAHLPDIPEVRSDYAFHLEGVKDVDTWVGIFVDDLKKRGLFDNTIIFFFSDHGGCSPRGKGYLYETGVRVPMIVYMPQKYREQFGVTPQTADKPVCFIDLAPTFLQLAGAQAPARYQGESFFKPLDGRTKYQYGVCGNQATHFQPLRSVSDGRYKYIRNFIPYKQHALRNYYQWGMPANIGWDSIYQKGLTNDITDNPFKCKFAEELYDLSVDQFETNNLADLPEYNDIKLSMRQKIDEFVTNTVDLGYVLRGQREKLNVYDYCRAPGYPLTQLHRLANLTCRVQTSDLPELQTALTSTYQEIRFWAVVNIGQLAYTGKITTAPAGLKNLLKDTSLEVAAETAYALCYLGEAPLAINYCMNLIRSRKNYLEAISTLEVLSLDDRNTEFFTTDIITELKTFTPVTNYASEKDLGIMVRGVLVNLKQFPANGIYDRSVYEEGLSVNKTRRSLVPRPGGVSASQAFFFREL
ncbi:MAG: sulfatase [Paludibacter sp.]|nr:sulfatase [Paludibacter sp.]